MLCARRTFYSLSYIDNLAAYKTVVLIRTCMKCKCRAKFSEANQRHADHPAVTASSPTQLCGSIQANLKTLLPFTFHLLPFTVASAVFSLASRVWATSSEGLQYAWYTKCIEKGFLCDFLISIMKPNELFLG